MILPALPSCGSPAPLPIFAAFFSRKEAGGVFRMNVKLRSCKWVTAASANHFP